MHASEPQSAEANRRDAITNNAERVRVDGKFFRVGDRKFHVKGITYGPFAPNAQNEPFASPEQTARDFKQINDLAANVLRVYYVPPIWFLDLAARHGLRVLIDIPWAKHLCFLDSDDSQAAARQAVRDAVRATRGHPAIFAYSVVNEISTEIVRWSGVARVEKFIDELIGEAKAIDPDCLCTFTSFPPTEYLRPEQTDFVCFNVYLHQILLANVRERPDQHGIKPLASLGFALLVKQNEILPQINVRRLIGHELPHDHYAGQDQNSQKQQ